MATPERPTVVHITSIDLSLRYLLLNQLLYLREAGYDIVTISSPGPDTAALTEQGIRHIPVTITREITPLTDLVTLWRLYRVMRRERFTIVHTHNPKPSLLGQLAARLARVPIVVNTIHGFYFHDYMSARKRRFYITMEQIGATCSHLIFSQNREDIAIALREKIGQPDKIHYLGNGIDLTVFDPAHISPDERAAARARLGIPDDAFVLGFVGRLAARRKGVLDYLAAAQRVIAAQPNTHLLIVGEADLSKPDAVRPEAAADYGLTDRAHFLGWRPNAELPLLYSLMDVVVLPSLFEGIPRVVMEASAMGVPAVVSDVRGNREAVEPGRNGWRVPFGDVDALAAAILQVLANGARIPAAQQRCRQLAEERFDERQVFERVRSAYARLLEQNAP